MRLRPSLPNIAAGVALGLLLGSGSAYAAVLVTGKDIVDGTIESKDIAQATIVGDDVKIGGLTGAHIASNGLTGIDVAPESLESSDIRNESLTGSDIKDFSLSNHDIGVLRATVDKDGYLHNSSGGVTVTTFPSSPSHYVVDFHRDVRACTATASVRTTQGYATVTNGWSQSSWIYVDTYGATGAKAPQDFNLVVVC